MNAAERIAAMRELAAQMEGIDKAVYQEYDKDWQQPIIGQGHPDTQIAFFGRDPGRDEVKHQMPFIGAGGQKVRVPAYEFLYNQPLPDFESSIKVGEHFYWINTVPYKPIGNKAWSMKIKKQFQPLMADLLIHSWNGHKVITLGREAFLWFAINQPRDVKQKLEAFWARDDRFETSIDIELTAIDGQSRVINLNPLPHPSPLNATWYKRFPALLVNRLQQLYSR